MELCSMLCATWMGGGFSGEWIHICVAESLPCSPKPTTTLLIGYTPIQNKKFKVWGGKELLLDSWPVIFKGKLFL